VGLAFFLMINQNNQKIMVLFKPIWDIGMLLIPLQKASSLKSGHRHYYYFREILFPQNRANE
jgi:hypothetical protein